MLMETKPMCIKFFLSHFCISSEEVNASQRLHMCSRWQNKKVHMNNFCGQFRKEQVRRFSNARARHW